MIMKLGVFLNIPRCFVGGGGGDGMLARVAAIRTTHTCDWLCACLLNSLKRFLYHLTIFELARVYPGTDSRTFGTGFLDGVIFTL